MFTVARRQSPRLGLTLLILMSLVVGSATASELDGGADTLIVLAAGSSELELAVSLETVEAWAGDDSKRDALLHVADFTNDGVPDLVAVRDVGGTASQRLVVFVGRAAIHSEMSRRPTGLRGLDQPLFYEPRDDEHFVTLDSPVESLLSADVDGDGDLDLLLAASGDDFFLVARGDGRGRFSAVQPIALVGQMVSWAKSDLVPADGIQDLVMIVAAGEELVHQVFQSPHGALAAPSRVVHLNAELVAVTRMQKAPVAVVVGRGSRQASVRWPSTAARPLATANRSVGSDYVVNSSGDEGEGESGVSCAAPGPCTLRAAIELANVVVGTQEISFSGAMTISPTFARGGIVATGPVVIDGAGLATVDPSGTPGSCALQIEGGASTVRGMIFDGVCLELETGDGNFVTGNYFGTTPALTTVLRDASLDVYSSGNTIGGTLLAERNYFARGSLDIGSGINCAEDNRVINNYFGVRADGSTPVDMGVAGGVMARGGVTVTGISSDGLTDCLANTIGGTLPGEGNVISGSLTPAISSSPISIGGGRGTLVQGNMLGASADGAARLVGTSQSGVRVTGGIDSLIGGTIPAALNVIAGNDTDFAFAYGLHITGSTGTKVQGNRIGTNALGTAAISRFEHGVYIENASDVTVGGTVAGAGNLISGNDRDGVHIADFGLTAITRNVVAGNSIGTNLALTDVIPNGEDGIEMTNLFGNDADVTVKVEANVIGGNLQQGIEIDRVGVTPKDILIVGNFIGTNAGGSTDLANGSHGVLIDEADDNTVGGAALGAANTIAFNDGDGVRVTENSCCFSGNTVSANSIYDNSGGGIGLSGGTNDGQEPPELTTVFETPVAVAGTFDGPLASDTTLEFFANVVCDGSGAGEGRRYLGSALVTSGSSSFSVSPGGTLAVGEIVTATSTDADGNTSFFSDCATAVTQDPIFSDGFESGSTSAWSSP